MGFEPTRPHLSAPRRAYLAYGSSCVVAADRSNPTRVRLQTRRLRIHTFQSAGTRIGIQATRGRTASQSSLDRLTTSGATKRARARQSMHGTRSLSSARPLGDTMCATWGWRTSLLRYRAPRPTGTSAAAATSTPTASQPDVLWASCGATWHSARRHARTHGALLVIFVQHTPRPAPAPSCHTHTVCKSFPFRCRYQTWFGVQPYYVHGIQMLPITPASEALLDAKWLEGGELDVYRASCDDACEQQGWSVPLLLATAVVDAAAAWPKVQALPASVFNNRNAGGNGNSRTASYYWVATRGSMPAE